MYVTDFIIVGGGLMGLLTARELRGTGASVTLVERGATGQESSWAGGGILSPLYPWECPAPVNALVSWSQKHYPLLASTLADETGIDAEWTRNGLLVLKSEARAQAMAWAHQAGVKLHCLHHTEMLQCEPCLGVAVNEALWLPDVAQIRNPRLLKAVRHSFLAAGGVIREHTEITGLMIRNDTIKGVETVNGPMRAPKVVLTAGAWTGRLLKNIGRFRHPTAMAAPWHPAIAALVHPCTADGGSVENAPGMDAQVRQAQDAQESSGAFLQPASGDTCTSMHDGFSGEIMPVRGQMILFRTPPGQISRIMVHNDHYVIPRRDGRVLAGSTVEYTGFDKSTTHQALMELRQAAVTLVPALADCEIEHHWAGLRPGLAAGRQGVPYIGEHPRVRGLFVNAGHFRNGVVMAPASVQLLTDMMLERAPVIDPQPYQILDVL